MGKPKIIKRISRYGILTNKGIICIVLLGIIMLWHAKLSFCQSDESFYLALVHRLWCGDHLLIDEWHPTQLYAPILLPFYSIFRLIVLDGKGAYLYARRAYLVFAIAITLLFYRRLIKRGANGGLPWTAAILPMLYSRANICGPSYYNLCMLFIILVVLFWCDHEEQSRGFIYWLFSGIFMALAVLCNAYLGVFVITGLIIAYICPRTRKKAKIATLGVILAGIVYILYLLQNEKLSNYLPAFSHILTDPLHQRSFLDSIRAVIISFKHNIAWSVVPLSVFGCFLQVYKYRCKRKESNIFDTAYSILSFCIILYTAVKSNNSICFVIAVPFGILVFPLVLKAILYRRNKFVLLLYGSGIALAISFCFASNTALDAMTSGFCLMSMAGFLLLYEEYNCTYENLNRLHAPVIICTSIIFLGTFALHRFWGIYRDAPVNELTCRIENGPAAGLYTKPEHALEYNAILNEIISLQKQFPDANVLYSKRLPWAYLVGDWRCSSFTAWTSAIDDPRFEQFFSTHALPDIIFILDDYTTDYDSAPFNNHKEVHGFNSNPLNGDFYQIIQNEYNLVKATDQFTVYIRSLQ